MALDFESHRLENARGRVVGLVYRYGIDGRPLVRLRQGLYAHRERFFPTWDELDRYLSQRRWTLVQVRWFG